MDFISAGHTNRAIREFFGLAHDNIANLRVNAAFSALGIPRPRYAEPRLCEFCGRQFTARDFQQKTCGSASCQTVLIGTHAFFANSKAMACAMSPPAAKTECGMVILRCSNGTCGAAWAGVVRSLAKCTEYSGMPNLACRSCVILLVALSVPLGVSNKSDY